MVGLSRSLRDKKIDEAKWLQNKCGERSLKFDRSFPTGSGFSSSTCSNWCGEAMSARIDSNFFLIPTWWGVSRVGSRFAHQDRLRKDLVLSQGINGPSVRIMLWKNYMGFDSRKVRKNLGDLIRAHGMKGKGYDIDGVENANQSFLGSLLGKAVSTYVSNQVEDCGELEVYIGGSNQEILSGQVKKVKILAKQVVYKGIALSDVDLSASSIKVKLGKKRLLENPFHVRALISIGEKDLEASLASPLLADYLTGIFPGAFNTANRLLGVKVDLQDGVLLLTDNDRQETKNEYNSDGKNPSVALSFEIMNGGKTVCINNAGDHGQADGNSIGKSFNVGSETRIQKLAVVDSRLVIGGEFYVTAT